MSQQYPQTNYFIAGDWGTSNLRLYLCEYLHDQRSNLIDTRFGPGISEIHGDFEEKLFNLTQDWFDTYGIMPMILSGMVGSTIGWKEAPYISCPVDVSTIAEGRLNFNLRDIDISILAGLKTSNPLGAPDVMRGEELQLLGWLRTNTKAKDDAHLFALPGTHNKWVMMNSGKIDNFLTSFTGELFGLLRQNSILINDDSAISFNRDAFTQGLDAINNSSDADLIHSLFSTRSKQVLGEIANSSSLSYLSGLITGTDVKRGTKLFYQRYGSDMQVTVIGEPALTEKYLLALDYFGIRANGCDPAQIAIAGFETIYQHIYQP